MTEYRLAKAAEDDLLGAFIYGLEVFGQAQAEKYRQSMIHCFQLLADAPHMGRRADDFAPGARRHEHGRHVIFYDEQPYGVLIIAVIHERSIRRWLMPGH